MIALRFRISRLQLVCVYVGWLGSWCRISSGGEESLLTTRHCAIELPRPRPRPETMIYHGWNFEGNARVNLDMRSSQYSFMDHSSGSSESAILDALYSVLIGCECILQIMFFFKLLNCALICEASKSAL